MYGKKQSKKVISKKADIEVISNYSGKLNISNPDKGYLRMKRSSKITQRAEGKAKLK